MRNRKNKLMFIRVDDEKNSPVSLSEGLFALLSEPPPLPSCPPLKTGQIQGAVWHAGNAFWQGMQ